MVSGVSYVISGSTVLRHGEEVVVREVEGTTVHVTVDRGHAGQWGYADTVEDEALLLELSQLAVGW